MSAALVKRLADAGLDAQAIVAAMEAFEAVEEERKAAKRAGNRERQTRKRERETGVSRVTERDDALQAVTVRDEPYPLPLPPQTPPTPTPTREEISPARKGRPAKPTFDDAEPGLNRIWDAANQTSRDRSGRPATAAALKAALEAGATLEAVEASVQGHCRATTDHAKGLHRIIEARLWRDHLARPAVSPTEIDPQVRAGRLHHLAKTGEWRPDWGPRPANDRPEPQTQDRAA